MKYIKDFDQWNRTKKNLDTRNQTLNFCEKEIWWCNVGVNIGSEQDGKGSTFLRPVYILKRINSETFLGIPLTSKLREDYAHISFYLNYDLNAAIISQIKTFDKKRLYKLIGITSNYLHERMKKATLAFMIS